MSSANAAARPAVLAVVLLLAAGCAGAQRASGSERQVRLAMAEQLAAQGDWGGAYRAADALYREEPRLGPARLLRGRALRHVGATAEADVALRELLVDEPRNARAHAELALVCERSGKPEDALAHHRKALELEPRSPRYLNNLGFALHLRGRSGEAIRLFEEGLRVDPSDGRLRNNLGFALAATGDFRRAAQQFQLGGTKAEARNNLGLAYEKAGDLMQAYEQYLGAVQLDASSATARGNLEHVARELGRVLPDLVTVPSAKEGS